MTNRDRIEAYFDNSLSTTEKESLLREIETDASLKSEYEFQKDIVEGIQAYRKQELIARLNAVKVASTGQTTLIKIVGSLGIAAVITGGAFWYFNDNTAQDSMNEVVSENITLEESLPSEPESTNTEPVVSDVVPEDNSENKPEQIEVVREAKQKEDSSTPDVVIPTMEEPDSEGIAALEENHDAPESMSSESLTISSSADIEVKLSKKYKFHYQVVNGDLTLYGDFDDSKFEVIELRTNKGINLYLFYKDFYYQLKSDSDKIRPLEAVESETLITELNKRR